MRYHPRSFVLFVFLLAGAAPLGAQTPPPVRPLGPVLATSVEPFASVSQVRALPGGRVIMHDLTGRRVVMLDSTFQHVTVIADTTSATGMAYGSRLGGIIAYRGDSTLFVDPQSISMLMIDPSGTIGRTMAAPLPNEVNQLIGGQNGTPGFDAQGRLVYRAQFRLASGAQRFGGGGAFAMPVLPDSSYVVRVDLKTRKVDTAAVFRIPKIGVSVSRDDNTGGISVITTVNPLPWTDDWALLSDGTLAVVRGQDYRVDFVAADGKVTSTPKLPFEWQRLSDEDKAAVIDSARGQMDKIRAAQIAQAQSMNANITVNAPDTSKSGRQRPQSDGANNATITLGGRGGGMAVNFSMPPVSFVSPSEMPDYRPAFRQGAALGDLAGNLWIRTSKSVNGGTVYDVVSNKGELTDRILIPPGRVIAGFGPGGVVYMGVIDGFVTRIERARVR
jgi:hypothetical protein